MTRAVGQSTDRRQRERRQIPRVPVLPGIPMYAEVVSSDKILRVVRCVNLGSRGALLDFGEGRCPNFPLDSDLLLTLRLGSDSASIPAVVRHRTPDRIGVFFPFEEDAPQREEQAQALALILRTLERAVARRSSVSSKICTTEAVAEFRSEATTNDAEPVADRRQRERRQVPRVPVLPGIPMYAEVVSSDKILRVVRCVNLGSRGALLDFGEGRCPNFPLDSDLLLTLRLGSDSASIPAVVRHRTPDRIGVFFPFEEDAPQREEQAQALALILRTLERAVARRKGQKLPA